MSKFNSVYHKDVDAGDVFRKAYAAQASRSQSAANPNHQCRLSLRWIQLLQHPFLAKWLSKFKDLPTESRRSYKQRLIDRDTIQIAWP